MMADPMREGLTPTITFELPDEPKPVVAKARIVWCRTSRIDPELYEVGLTFTELSDESRRRVLEFVDAHLSPQKN